MGNISRAPFASGLTLYSFQREMHENRIGQSIGLTVMPLSTLKLVLYYSQDAPTEEETSPTLSEETLIVIVSVISAVTIVVALVFFLIVVRVEYSVN